jgi:hypothetical protein
LSKTQPKGNEQELRVVIGQEGQGKWNEKRKKTGCLFFSSFSPQDISIFFTCLDQSQLLIICSFPIHCAPDRMESGCFSLFYLVQSISTFLYLSDQMEEVTD